jgi:hypothetical protein
MTGYLKMLVIGLLVLLTGGCATTYVPISWGFGERVQLLSRSDLTLLTLFNRYDPQRTTLRVSGTSFDEVMMPSQVQFHLGAYRLDSKLIYRNLYHEYSDQELRDLMVHEFAHHIWFNFMSPEQRNQWCMHLDTNPTPLRKMVRYVYTPRDNYPSEDFAFTVEFARQVDIEALGSLKIISAQERTAILDQYPLVPHKGPPPGHSHLFAADTRLTTDPGPIKTVPLSIDKGTAAK